MKTKHTPGPWKYAPAQRGTIFGERVEDAHGSTICQMSHHPAEQIAAKANARLVAAAPEMLAELELLAESFGWPSDHPACIVIAKAKGDA